MNVADGNGSNNDKIKDSSIGQEQIDRQLFDDSDYFIGFLV